jgi:hypothetical protein
VLDLRLFRACLLPFFVILAIVAFSVHPLPGAGSSSTPAPPFDGPRAFNTLTHLEAAFPHRFAGSLADRRLEALLAGRLRGDGYRVRTAAGTVIATQGGSGGPALMLLADRAGSGAAALSGTAALLELGHDFAGRGGLRPLVLVSTAGSAVPPLGGPVGAAIVLGDLGGVRAHQPSEIPFSNDGSVAPLALQQVLTATLPGNPERPQLPDQLAQLAVPFSPTTQASLIDAGIPAVLAQQSGEIGPAAGEAVRESRLAAFGRGIASALSELESAAPLASSTRDLTLAGDQLGGWAIRALVGALLLAVALPGFDAFARARRRRVPLARWCSWLLLWAGPPGATILFTHILASAGALGTVPGTPAILAPGARGILMLAATLAFFALACIARRELAGPPPSDRAGAGVCVIGAGALLAILIWIANPYTAALLAIPLIPWLVLLTAEREHAHHPLVALAWLAVSLVPLAGVLSVQASSFGMGPLRFAWSWLLLLASGQLSLLGFLALSLAGGLYLATAILLLRPALSREPRELKLSTRGPLGYAGPGSLGGSSSGTPSGR